MTYFLTALTNDRARLIATEARVTCAETAELIAKTWADQGFIIVRREEN